MDGGTASEGCSRSAAESVSWSACSDSTGFAADLSRTALANADVATVSVSVSGAIAYTGGPWRAGHGR
ncbi:hypothetical protein [Spirillospora sp. NPDC048824]|uniref:hypothetical protein n=1 Tax=Spirillospora sp. NPDC048824 TaxID=3364526 RepID=UPI00371AF533